MNNDTFHVIGFTSEDIQKGATFRVMRLSEYTLKNLMALNQRYGALKPAIQEGLLVEEQVEVLFLFTITDPDGARKYKRQFSDDYQEIEYFNDVAFRLCKEYGIEIPPVIKTITRSELPDAPYLGTSMSFRNVRPK